MPAKSSPGFLSGVVNAEYRGDYRIHVGEYRRYMGEKDAEPYEDRKTYAQATKGARRLRSGRSSTPGGERSREWA